MTVAKFKSGGVFPLLELDFCIASPPPWLRREETTPFSRDILHLLVWSLWICGGIHTTLRLKAQGVLTVRDFPPQSPVASTSLNIFVGIWGLRKPSKSVCGITGSFVEHWQIIPVTWVIRFCTKLWSPCQNTKIFLYSWHFFPQDSACR